jgi:hypothetical protein
LKLPLSSILFKKIFLDEENLEAFFLQNYNLLSIKDNSLIFKDNEFELESFDESVFLPFLEKKGFTLANLEKNEIKYVDNLNDLIDYVSNFKVIAVQDDLQDIITNNFDCSYLELNDFQLTWEGYLWDFIFNLKNKPWPKEFLFKFAEFGFNVGETGFPYLQMSSLKDNANLIKLEKMIDSMSLVEAFEFISGKMPLWKPSFFDYDSLRAAKFFKKHEGKDLLIVPIDFADKFENILVISNNVSKKKISEFNLNVVYENDFSINKNPFEVKVVDLHIESNKDYSLAIKGEFAKAYSKKNDLEIKSDIFYLEIYKLIVSYIKKSVSNEKCDSSWLTFLEFSGLEYIKVKNKAENMISIFLSWFEEQLFESYEFNKKIVIYDNVFHIAFCGKKRDGSEVYLDFRWQTPSSAVIKKDLKIKDIVESGNDYYISSTSKIIKIDANSQFEDYEPGNKVLEQEDDLFSWSKATFNLLE